MKKKSVRIALAVGPPVALLIALIIVGVTGGGPGTGGSPNDFWYRLRSPAPATPSTPTQAPVPSPATTPNQPVEPTPSPSGIDPSPSESAQPSLPPDDSCAVPAPADTTAVRDLKDGLCVAVYRVKPWDTLSAIAERYASPLTDVYQWSLGSLGPSADPNLIYPDQEIVVKVLAKL